MAEKRIDWKRLRHVMTNYGAQVVREMVTRLTGFDKRASGELIESLGYTFIETDGQLQLVFLAAEHWQYVDKGRKPGKQPPLYKIKAWRRIKGLPDRAAFPIDRNIGRYVIPPTNFFTISTTRRQAQYVRNRDEAIRQDIAEAAAELARLELGRKRKR